MGYVPKTRIHPLEQKLRSLQVAVSPESGETVGVRGPRLSVFPCLGCTLAMTAVLQSLV
jgi:hypothetical protein